MEKEKGEEDEGSTCLWMLPEGCIVEILALTSLPDVCRLSLVSSSLRSAANSDFVWAKFLLSDYRSIIAGSTTPIPDFRSLKDLYVYLSHHPLLIDEGRKVLKNENQKKHTPHCVLNMKLAKAKSFVQLNPPNACS
ncbi:hypothetical protein RND71_022134 [Anisodus tanguticus]|uniref:F-box domain-containing protein n=1 Tax=Anisodus tanguticus TaxID=243964 RepID=A0AAE1VGT7_9SOLA|nr:hypothetical protein RND71_022134 [Anisodus tanguticus]